MVTNNINKTLSAAEQAGKNLKNGLQDQQYNPVDAETQRIINAANKVTHDVLKKASIIEKQALWGKTNWGKTNDIKEEISYDN